MAGPESLLHDLLDEFGLSEYHLDEELSEDHLTEVSKIVDDHEAVGPGLGLTEQEMAAINLDASTQERQKEVMLRHWKQKFSQGATYRVLIEAFLRCSGADRARKVCELLAKSKFCGMHCRDNTMVDLQ